jgi:energy-coupling factor transport system substrate-specific component
MATESSLGRAMSASVPVDWHWRTRDFIVAAALAVPLGLVWSFVWGTVWLTARGITPELGNIFDGFYIVAGVLVGYVVRKPGAALLGEMIAALLEIPFTPFGAVVLVLGFLQGIGVEAVFFATRYRRYDLPMLLVAGALGSFVALAGYSYWSQGWMQLAVGLQLLRLVLKLLGGAFFAGLVGKLLADALVPTGVLDNFAIARARRQAV